MKSIVLAFALAGALTAQASNAEQEVRAVLHDWLEALAANDVARVERIIADDYRITLGDGRVLDKHQDLEVLHSGKVKFQSADAEDVVVRIFDRTAIVTGLGKYTVTVDGKTSAIQERFTDIYVKRDKGWQPVASHSTPIKTPAKP